MAAVITADFDITVLDQLFNPMQQLTVEAYSLDAPTSILATTLTDNGGHAVFTGLQWRTGIRPRVQRAPTVSGNGVDSAASGSGMLQVQVTKTPTPILKAASADLTLTNAYQDVAGATVTLDVAGTYLVTGVFTFAEVGAGDLAQIMSGALKVDATVQTAVASTTFVTAGDSFQVQMAWYVTVAAGKVVKLQAKKAAGTGGTLVNHLQTYMLVQGPL